MNLPDPTKPAFLGTSDVAAIVGKLDAAKRRAQELAGLFGMVEDEDVVNIANIFIEANDEALRVIAHAQGRDK